jgi:hypothetical protein
VKLYGRGGGEYIGIGGHIKFKYLKVSDGHGCSKYLKVSQRYNCN